MYIEFYAGLIIQLESGYVRKKHCGAGKMPAPAIVFTLPRSLPSREGRMRMTRWVAFRYND